MIPLSVPSIKGNEWKYIKECLDTEWVSSAGKYVDAFEKEIAKYTGSKHAIACVNGTSALHISLLIAGVKPGDEVIVPTVTFIAPINVVRYAGAEPIFMDCDDFYNIDIKKVIDFIVNETEYREAEKCTYNKKTKKKISAIIPVHIFGNAVWLDELIGICDERNISILEDATESLGTFYNKGKYAGRHTGTIGKLGCFSFNGNKIITTGGGGMIITDSEELALKAKYFTTQAKDDEIRYIHNDIGYNYRLTNIQAALGLAQLEKLPQFLKIKSVNYFKYKQQIDLIQGLHLAETPSYANCNIWMYALQIDKAIYGKDRDTLMNFLNNNKIQTRPVWFPNHMQKPYKTCYNYKIEKAYNLIDNTLNIPCSVNIRMDEIDYVIEMLKESVNKIF
ncbi:MAG: LegC family aminotransferase [Bacteroidales bacterium]|nr:LegC family aminotransferase [Bacteroidales bacterium]